jgi:hypothetical protein
MNAEPTGDTAAAPSRAWLKARRRAFVSVITAAVLVGAFLLWGPVGLGSGPLSVQMAATVGWTDTVPGPVGAILPIYNAGHALAVVDRVEVVGGTTYPGPHVLALGVVTSAACIGAFPARPAGRGFVLVRCGGGYRGQLVGHAFGFTHGVSPGWPAAAEMAAPRPGTCWVMTEVVVHYHVGIRHFSVTDPYQLAVCRTQSSAAVNAAMKAAEASG